jgi:hypothetical protein
MVEYASVSELSTDRLNKKISAQDQPLTRDLKNLAERCRFHIGSFVVKMKPASTRGEEMERPKCGS